MTTLQDEIGKQQDSFNENIRENVIKGTRRIIKNMSETQKFEKAKAHIIDALKYRHPRFESVSLETRTLFHILYVIHSNELWSWLLFIGGYMYLCLIVLDNESYSTKIIFETILLVLFWADTIIYMYIKKFDNFKGQDRFTQSFYFKCAIIFLMTIDLIIFISYPCYGARPIRPFRIFRCFVPLLFDPEMRKALIALLSAYKDILVYLIFFTSIIVGYSLLGNRALTFDPNYKDPNFPQNVDPYKTNYGDLVHMIFNVYVTSSYDSYPDNQILAIQNYELNYLYFIIFIFMNMFLFSSIPGSLIYLVFRGRRSKMLLMDQIRQQHSLILAFVTLAENEANLSIGKLVKFLLFLYRYKIRYVEYITDICLKLDNNNNKSIQVYEFMQLSKILLQNEAMLPPKFDDIDLWLKFRDFMNTRLYLKAIVRHWCFQLIVSVIIILSFINAIFFMFYNSHLVQIFDNIFIWIFMIELVLRVIAIGPENFFIDRWNNVDTFLVTIGLIFFFVPNSHNADGIVRMSRIFRLASLLRLLSHSHYLKNIKFQIWNKLKNIYSILLQILPIILRFMPLFVFFFSIFSILGMEFFYNFYDTLGSPLYNQYQQFANFRSFIRAQYYMVQVLTQAGWSQVAFDHCWRAPQYFTYIMLYFCMLHIIIVYILATLIKGIFWEVFFTVNTIFANRDKENIDQQKKEEQIFSKTLEIDEINKAINAKELILPNTILRRELIENKFDEEIFKKLKLFYENDGPNSPQRLRKRSFITQRIIQHWEIDLNEIELSQDARRRYGSKKQLNLSSEGGFESQRDKVQLHEIQQIDEQDFESELSELLDKLVINPKIKYNEVIASPKIFVDFLKSKLKSPDDLINDQLFNLHENPLYNQESMYYLIYEIHALLDIQTSKREQKAMIINSLIEENVISEEQGDKLIKKKLQEKIFHIDTNGVLRKLFMSGINQDLIKKFQIEYFSDIYGYSFKHINKMTLEPLLKYEATLTYSLRTILRYPQINNTEFFEMLTSIEDKISNKLLQRGSLFKYIYKLDHQGDIWFSIEYKKQQEMKVHFLKSGIWCYYKQMQQKQVLYARDMFNWNFPQNCDKKMCQQYIKRFYQSFEALAFSLLGENNFFESNPKYHIYDLYIQHFDVEKTSRFKKSKLEISKIMVVILSKEEERADLGMKELDYQLSDIKVKSQKGKKNIDFKFDDTEDETFQKLKNIGAVDVQKIVESEGLPFSFVVDLMKEISDFISIYAMNFVYQIEKVLNEQYEEMNEEAMQNQANKPKSQNERDATQQFFKAEQ